MSNSFRWPAAGDRVFKIEYKSWQNAAIEECAQRRLHLMASGYKLIADQAVERIIDRKDPYLRDTLVYPIFFNYRHFIEISLKVFIEEFAAEAGVEAGKMNHELLPLWQTYISIADAIIGPARDKDVEAAVESVIAEFHQFDPGSFNMRYSTDIKGRQIILPHTALGLTALKDVMNSVGNFFDGSMGYVSELVAASKY